MYVHVHSKIFTGKGLSNSLISLSNRTCSAYQIANPYNYVHIHYNVIKEDGIFSHLQVLYQLCICYVS